ncbi:hypothetical protein ACFQJ5_14445 [Halomicroarcula sp. GCM10025324]|uniref:hypothetical protein n=1 Tax=Haloarcula TaxID=2237 RepID=UPI0023E7E133|nr:hypothetical protein [Halomicroarcula sp. ZS-22-S1]
MTISLENRNRGAPLSIESDRLLRCPECHARCTIGTDGQTEYGHLTGCPRRPADFPKGGGYVQHRDHIDVSPEVA